MNKTELVETISQRTDIAKKDVQAVLDTFEDIAGEIVAKGKDTLYTHAIDGFKGTAGVMPAKGGNPALTDEQVKATVDWMLGQLK